jgi:hypothetical protein
MEMLVGHQRKTNTLSTGNDTSWRPTMAHRRQVEARTCVRQHGPNTISLQTITYLVDDGATRLFLRPTVWMSAPRTTLPSGANALLVPADAATASAKIIKAFIIMVAGAFYYVVVEVELWW